MLRNLSLALLVFILFNSCADMEPSEKEPELPTSNKTTNRILLSSEINWEKLNPARGDQSPQAGTIWGDRKAGAQSTGFLAKFVDGFSSPPHIHNITYRAVVISGLIHNDDPEAENMWMSPGSFWTQPAGESHITSAQGEECIALVEINQGPYLVKGTSEAFDNGERPINIDASNIIWLDNSKSNWIDPESNAELSFLLKDGEYKSLFVKIPKGYNGQIRSNGKVLHAVIISGELDYSMPDEGLNKLDVGSYFGSSDLAIHSISNTTDEDCLIYIRCTGEIQIQ